MEAYPRGHKPYFIILFATDYKSQFLMVSLDHFLASLIAPLVKNLPAMPETWVDPWVGKIPQSREKLPAPVFWPGEIHRPYRPWGHKESAMTQRLSLHFTSLSFCYLIIQSKEALTHTWLSVLYEIILQVICKLCFQKWYFPRKNSFFP